MSTKAIVTETTYYKAAADAEYMGRDEIMEVMRDSDSEIIELAISPDAQSKTNDRLYIRVSAHVLMAALTDVLMDREVK